VSHITGTFRDTERMSDVGVKGVRIASQMDPDQVFNPAVLVSFVTFRGDHQGASSGTKYRNGQTSGRKR